MPRKKTTRSTNLPAVTSPKKLPLPQHYTLGGTVIEPTQIFAIPSRHPSRHGPWSDEPDRIAWRDASTGLDCLILRMPDGTLSGFVAVPLDHPLAGYRVDAVPASASRAPHRGIGYASLCDQTGPEATRICHVGYEHFRRGRALPSRMPDIGNAYWFGFDTDKPGDFVPVGTKPARHREEGEVYRDVHYVAGETLKLADALKALDNPGVPIAPARPLATPVPSLGKPVKGDRS